MGCVICSLVTFLTGCATYSTISQADYGTAKVFSGTRLDIRGLAGVTKTDKKFKVTPPPYPLVDLPFSLVSDVLIFPLTFSAALYEWIVGTAASTTREPSPGLPPDVDQRIRFKN